jgi:hypothetical protein
MWLIPLKAHAVESENLCVSLLLRSSSHNKKRSARILVTELISRFTADTAIPDGCFHRSPDAWVPADRASRHAKFVGYLLEARSTTSNCDDRQCNTGIFR